METKQKIEIYLGRFCPEWKVDREGTFLGKAFLFVGVPPDPGKPLGLFELKWGGN